MIDTKRTANGTAPAASRALMFLNTGGLMKAIVQDTYGEPEAVLGLQDVAKPIVRDSEVLVRVHAASVHVGDWMLVTGVPYIARPAYGLRSRRARFPGPISPGRSRRSAMA